MRGDVGMYAFTGPPQPVEIEHRGVWYRGELLGWRHSPDGRCLARVRCVVGTLRHSAWVDLADLRLPEPDAPDVVNPPIDLGPAVRRTPRLPAAPLPPPPSLASRESVLDDETRPHELLPGLSRRPQPPPATRPLPPPRAYQEQVERQQRYSHA